MNLSDENIQTQKSSRKVNLLSFFLLLIAVVTVSFFVYLKSRNVDVQNVSVKELFSSVVKTGSRAEKEKKSLEIKYDSKEQPVFCTFNDLIIKCSSNGISAFEKTGMKSWEHNMAVHNPILKESGNFLLVADVGGRDIYVLSGKDIKWHKKMDSSIVNAEISDNGYVSVIHEEKRYNAAVTIFNSDGIERMTRLIGEKLVLSTKVSSSRKQAVFNCVDTSGVTVNSELVFLDMSSGEPFFSLPSEDTLLHSIWYLKDESIFAVGDNRVLCAKKSIKDVGKQSSGKQEDGIKWKHEWEDGKVLGAGVILGKYGVAAVAGDASSGIFNSIGTDVLIFNTSGQPKTIYQVDGMVRNIETHSDIIAINTGREAIFINSKGEQIYRYAAKSDISKICFLNKQEAVIITKTDIVISGIN